MASSTVTEMPVDGAPLSSTASTSANQENRNAFEALCRELNVDVQTRSAAWQILERIPARENVRL
jgi:hypothetical protein